MLKQKILDTYKAIAYFLNEQKVYIKKSFPKIYASNK